MQIKLRGPPLCHPHEQQFFSSDPFQGLPLQKASVGVHWGFPCLVLDSWRLEFPPRVGCWILEDQSLKLKEITILNRNICTFLRSLQLCTIQNAYLRLRGLHIRSLRLKPSLWTLRSLNTVKLFHCLKAPIISVFVNFFAYAPAFSHSDYGFF